MRAEDVVIWDHHGSRVGAIDRHGNVTDARGDLAGRLNGNTVEYSGWIVGWIDDTNVYYTATNPPVVVGRVVGTTVYKRIDKEGHLTEAGTLSVADPDAGAAALLLIFRKP